MCTSRDIRPTLAWFSNFESLESLESGRGPKKRRIYLREVCFAVYHSLLLVHRHLPVRSPVVINVYPKLTRTAPSPSPPLPVVSLIPRWPARQIDLVRLPHAYTELHAQVSACKNGGSSGGEGGAAAGGGAAGADRVGHPAVCLVCGEVLDASGRGACTRHARDCGCGLGLFFLLQVGRLSIDSSRLDSSWRCFGGRVYSLGRAKLLRRIVVGRTLPPVSSVGTSISCMHK